MLTNVPLVITIDTEADNEWGHGLQATYRNISVLPRLQELCDRYGMKPTYLVTYDVARDPASRETLRGLIEIGKCEIGAHLHGWRTPPFVPGIDDRGASHPYLHEYLADVQAAKLQNLNDALSEELGVTPVSYRGGRWSLDETALDILEAAGYIVDTTVSPGMSWKHMRGRSRGGCTFIGAPWEPYHPTVGDLLRPGNRKILEAPVSIVPTGPLFPYFLGTRGKAWDCCSAGRLVARVVKRLGLARAIWLHPVRSSVDEMRLVCNERRASGILNMMFHSSELIAGGARGVPDETTARTVWERIEAILAWLQGIGVSGSTASEFARRVAA